MHWARRSAKIFWCRSMLKNLCSLIVALLVCQGAAFAQTSTAAKPTPSTSASTTTTTTKKPANTGEIFRWIDSKGKVQYSSEVPEDRRSTARKVDTRTNIVSSRVPASIQGEPQPPPQPQSALGEAAPAARQPITERDKCEAAWQAYRAAEQCFAQYRQSTAGGVGNKAGSKVSAEAQEKCPSLTEPQTCR